MRQSAAALADKSDPPILDPEALATVRADTGDALFAHLVGMFDAEQARRVAMLHEALAEDDREAIAFQAHVLRGAGAQLAGHRLAAIAAQLEREARAAGPQRLTRLVGEVIALSADTFTALRGVLPGA